MKTGIEKEEGKEGKARGTIFVFTMTFVTLVCRVCASCVVFVCCACDAVR